MRQQLEPAAPLSVLVEREPMPLGLLRRERDRIGAFARGNERRDFSVNARRPHGADAADGNSFRGQALVRVVGPQRQPIFGARGEHAIRLADAARHQVVDHHADVGLRAIENDLGPLAGARGGIEACNKSLCRRFFVAGGAVDLAGEKKSAQPFGLQRRLSARADRRNRIRWHSRAARTLRFPSREWSRPERAGRLPAARWKCRSDRRSVSSSPSGSRNI